MRIRYIGKSILIEKGRKKALVVGDIHLGYGENKEYANGIIGGVLFKELVKDLNEIFNYVGKVGRVVLLGDLKHGFSRLEKGERYDFVNLFDFLLRNAEEIVVLKGNHDNYLIDVLKGRGIKIYDYFIDDGACFLHGDRNFPEIWKKEIKCILMGHFHPAIKLIDGLKVEKYKCFLSGEHRGKEIIVLPSFVEAGEGINAREIDGGVFGFDFREFNVGVVGEDLKVLDFGKLGKIR